jgi:uncharacterized protein (DUF486 family)
MRDAWIAAGLLLLSNGFMTTAWYGHLRYPSLPLWVAIFGSWGIALLEYVLQVPANRIGHHVLSAYQLKIMQEAITLVVFVVLSRVLLGERLSLRHAASFALVFAAVVIGFKD